MPAAPRFQRSDGSRAGSWVPNDRVYIAKAAYAQKPQPPQYFGQQLLRRDAKCLRVAAPACQHIADERVATGVVEQHRLGIGLKLCRDLGELGRASPVFQLADVAKLPDKGA